MDIHVVFSSSRSPSQGLGSGPARAAATLALASATRSSRVLRGWGTGPGGFAEGLLEGALAAGAAAPRAPGYAPGDGGPALGAAPVPLGDVLGGVPGLDAGLNPTQRVD